MAYQAELAFLQKLLENFRLQTLRFNPADSPELDLGLRRLLGLQDPRMALLGQIRKNTVYFVTDGFECCYNGLLLPEENEVLLIGPYMRREMSDTEIMSLLERFHLSTSLLPSLKQYYCMLPLINFDNTMLCVLNTLGETLWGSVNAFSVESVESSEAPSPLSPLPAQNEKGREEVHMQMIEARYEGERALMHAVSHGMNHQAQMIISQWRMDALEQRATDPVRNLRNYAIILNTLLRKAAEEGHVHPVHIDQLSSSIARRIETFTHVGDGLELLKSMVHKYCLLVKNHSMRSYSKLVQHVILRIDTDLTADLSLKTHADHFSVNASYLSSLFKKETGLTLTEYVNRARIDHAIFLLNATDMQVQTIAQYCGIPDVNYFTKLFKKHIGKTPKEYRIDTRRMSAER